MSIITSLVLLFMQDVKIGTLAPEASRWVEIILDMGEDWKKASGGKIRLVVFPNGVAGDESVMVRKMRLGQLHAAAITSVGLSDIVPEIAALQMPMMFRSYEELDYVMERIAPRLEKLLADKGFVVLNWGDAGWVHFFAKTPVASLDDLRKQKLFVWAGNSKELDVWKSAGCNPVPLPATEIHTALQSGLITALSTTPLASLSNQWFGSAVHMTDLKWAPLIGATIITKKKWTELGAGLHPALLKASGDAGAKMKREVRTLGDEAVGVMKKREGFTVHAVGVKAAAEFETQARAAWPKIASGTTWELVTEVEKLVIEYRTLKGKK